MFLGHFAVGLAAKKWAPRTSVGTLFLASQFLDLLWPTFLLTGLEDVRIEPGITAASPLNFSYYPYSHSLLAALIWAVLFACGYFLFDRNIRRAAITGTCVLSHWLLDLLVHRPDLPLVPQSGIKVGFGLWNSFSLELLLEVILLLVGLVLYLSATIARNRTGVFWFWTLIFTLVLIQLLNAFGPPPVSVMSIAWGAQLQWILVAWAYWADKKRIYVRRQTLLNIV